MIAKPEKNIFFEPVDVVVGRRDGHRHKLDRLASEVTYQGTLQGQVVESIQTPKSTSQGVLRRRRRSRTAQDHQHYDFDSGVTTSLNLRVAISLVNSSVLPSTRSPTR